MPMSNYQHEIRPLSGEGHPEAYYCFICSLPATHMALWKTPTTIGNQAQTFCYLCADHAHHWALQKDANIT